jgi:hypothetical protein
MIIRTPLVQKFPRYLATLQQSVYSEREICRLIEDYAKAVNDPFDAATEIYLQYMVEKGAIRQIVVDGEKRGVKRYLTRTDASRYEIACSLQRNSYLSHLAAAYFHKLVQEEPAKICISAEGAPREANDDGLGQEKIDMAFEKPQRRSGAKMQWDNNVFLLLKGSYAGGAGIEKRKYFSLSSIERTLIDLTVRPAYGGGSVTILEIYKKAIPAFTIGNIFKLLDRLSYKYPYHQSVGFYLSLAGYNNQQELNKLKKMGMDYTFYLDYEMTDTIYSDEWNVYFPKDLI